MPNIQGGGGFVPQPIQPQAPAQRAAQAQAPAEQTQLAPKDTFKAGPSQTTQTSQTVQRLTADTTKAQIHQLIQQTVIQVPAERPQLQLLQRPAMGSALAEALAQHHVPDAPQQAAQQQAQQPALNPHAQLAAGLQQTSTFVRQREHSEDSVARNSQQSGKRVRKEDQEGEFSSLDDTAGGEGGMFGGNEQDERSDSQKKKQILTAEEKRKAPPGTVKSSLSKAPPPKPTLKPTLKPVAKPTIQRVQPPLSGQAKPKPQPTDEWTL